MREGAQRRCPKCHGSGMEVRIHQLGPSMIQQIQTVCSQCQGQGEWIRPRDCCLTCNGRKVVREKKILSVHLDKGEPGLNASGVTPKCRAGSELPPRSSQA